MTQHSLAYSRLVAYGEAMLRITSGLGLALTNAGPVSLTIGGAELNAAIAARANGLPTTWTSALGPGAPGRAVVEFARHHQIDIDLVATTAERTGVYFVEPAVFPRSTQVTYDRAGSSFASIERIDWRSRLKADTCFYTTGISAAVSPGSRANVEEALQVAAECGATTAFDLNYRARLWPRQEAFDWLQRHVDKIDILAIGADDLDTLGLSTHVAAARAELGVAVLVVTTKSVGPGTIESRWNVATADDEATTFDAGVVVDPIGSGDAAFGTFLATMPSVGLSLAAGRATRAAVYACGIPGDAMALEIGDSAQRQVER